MTILLTIILVLLSAAIGFNIYLTMKTLGILIQIVEFINDYAKARKVQDLKVDKEMMQ